MDQAPRPPDLTPAIRSWFGEAGFREEAFDTSHDGFMSVGAHRLTGEPAELTPGQRLFTFPAETEPGTDWESHFSTEMLRRSRAYDRAGSAFSIDGAIRDPGWAVHLLALQ